MVYAEESQTMTQLKKIIIWVLLIASIGTVIYFAVQLFFANKQDSEQRPAVQFITDTVTVTEYRDRVEYRDKLIYKVIYTNVTPLVPRAERVIDTVFKESVKYKDMILSLKSGRKNVEVFAYNEHDSLLKKYIFENAGSQYMVWADSGAVRLDRQWLTWDGIDIGVKGYFAVSDKYLKTLSGPFIEGSAFLPGVKTGVSLFGKLGVSGGVYYNTTDKKINLLTEVNYKIF